MELFGFSFLIIVANWVAYTRIDSALPVETSSALILNLALLFCVVIEPFLFYVFETSTGAFYDTTSAAFAPSRGMMAIMLNVARKTLMYEPRTPATKVYGLPVAMPRK